MTAPWITYRPGLKVVDCTIRDGGLINDHALRGRLCAAVYDACVAAGIDYMEVGYKASEEAPSRATSSARGSSATRTICGAWWATIPRR